MIVAIHRHAQPTNGGVVGDLIESEVWGMDFLPRPGDLLTVHPDEEPSVRSWTGRVTGVQHVLRIRRSPLAVVTVLEEA